MSSHGTAKTSIGFGGGEVILVATDLDETRRKLAIGVRESELFEVVDVLTGETKIVNPLQVKVLQRVDDPLPLLAAVRRRRRVASPLGRLS